MSGTAAKTQGRQLNLTKAQEYRENLKDLLQAEPGGHLAVKDIVIFIEEAAAAYFAIPHKYASWQQDLKPTMWQPTYAPAKVLLLNDMDVTLLREIEDRVEKLRTPLAPCSLPTESTEGTPEDSDDYDSISDDDDDDDDDDDTEDAGEVSGNSDDDGNDDDHTENTKETPEGDGINFDHRILEILGGESF